MEHQNGQERLRRRTVGGDAESVLAGQQEAPVVAVSGRADGALDADDRHRGVGQRRAARRRRHEALDAAVHLRSKTKNLGKINKAQCSGQRNWKE